MNEKILFGQEYYIPLYAQHIRVLVTLMLHFHNGVVVRTKFPSSPSLGLLPLQVPIPSSPLAFLPTLRSGA